MNKLKISNKRIKNELKIFLNEIGLVDDAYICGGAIRGFFDKSKIADIDLFFLNESSRNKQYLALENAGATLIFQCKENKLSSFVYENIKIQLISP